MASNVLDHWAASIAAGRATEQAIATTFMHQAGIELKDNTLERKKNPDLLGTFTAEIKLCLSPYPSSPTPAKLMREHHLTLDVSNLDDYAPQTLIIFVVDYTRSELLTKGVYFITAGEAAAIVDDNPRRIYRRSGRSAMDKIVKCAISTAECGTLTFPGMTMAQTVDAIMEEYARIKAVA